MDQQTPVVDGGSRESGDSVGQAAPAIAGDAHDTLASSLRLAVTRLARRLRQQSVDQITASQLSALTSVAKHGPLSLGELAGIEKVAPPSMTRIAGRLEEMGYIARKGDAADRRVARVTVTAAGAALLADTSTRRDLFLARRLSQLAEGDRSVLASALPLLERLAEEEDSPAP